MKINRKQIGKVAPGAAVGAVVAGFKAAGKTVKDILKEQEASSAEMVAVDLEEILETEIQ